MKSTTFSEIYNRNDIHVQGKVVSTSVADIVADNKQIIDSDWKGVDGEEDQYTINRWLKTRIEEVENSIQTDFPDISGKVDRDDLAQVAFTGNYQDLSNKPVNVATQAWVIDEIHNLQINNGVPEAATDRYGTVRLATTAYDINDNDVITAKTFNDAKATTSNYGIVRLASGMDDADTNDVVTVALFKECCDDVKERLDDLENNPGGGETVYGFDGTVDPINAPSGQVSVNSTIFENWTTTVSVYATVNNLPNGDSVSFVGKPDWVKSVELVNQTYNGQYYATGLTIEVLPNKSTESRSSIIRILNGTKPLSITINQAGAEYADLYENKWGIGTSANNVTTVLNKSGVYSFEGETSIPVNHTEQIDMHDQRTIYVLQSGEYVDIQDESVDQVLAQSIFEEIAKPENWEVYINGVKFTTNSPSLPKTLNIKDLNNNQWSGIVLSSLTGLITHTVFNLALNENDTNKERTGNISITYNDGLHAYSWNIVINQGVKSEVQEDRGNYKYPENKEQYVSCGYAGRTILLGTDNAYVDNAGEQLRFYFIYSGDKTASELKDSVVVLTNNPNTWDLVSLGEATGGTLYELTSTIKLDTNTTTSVKSSKITYVIKLDNGINLYWTINIDQSGVKESDVTPSLWDSIINGLYQIGPLYPSFPENGGNIIVSDVVKDDEGNVAPVQIQQYFAENLEPVASMMPDWLTYVGATYENGTINFAFSAQASDSTELKRHTIWMTVPDRQDEEPVLSGPVFVYIKQAGSTDLSIMEQYQFTPNQFTIYLTEESHNFKNVRDGGYNTGIKLMKGDEVITNYFVRYANYKSDPDVAVRVSQDLSSQSWLNFDMFNQIVLLKEFYDHGEGDGIIRLLFSTTKNTGNSRTATVTLTHVKSRATATITVIQLGPGEQIPDATLDIYPQEDPDKSQITIPYAAEKGLYVEVPVVVNSNIPWSITAYKTDSTGTKQSEMTTSIVDNASIFGQGDKVVLCRFINNPTSYKNYYTIVAQGGGLTDSITVIQEANVVSANLNLYAGSNANGHGYKMTLADIFSDGNSGFSMSDLTGDFLVVFRDQGYRSSYGTDQGDAVWNSDKGMWEYPDIKYTYNSSGITSISKNSETEKMSSITLTSSSDSVTFWIEKQYNGILAENVQFGDGKSMDITGEREAWWEMIYTKKVNEDVITKSMNIIIYQQPPHTTVRFTDLVYNSTTWLANYPYPSKIGSKVVKGGYVELGGTTYYVASPGVITCPSEPGTQYAITADILDKATEDPYNWTLYKGSYTGSVTINGTTYSVEYKYGLVNDTTYPLNWNGQLLYNVGQSGSQPPLYVTPSDKIKFGVPSSSTDAIAYYGYYSPGNSTNPIIITETNNVINHSDIKNCVGQNRGVAFGAKESINGLKEITNVSNKFFQGIIGGNGVLYYNVLHNDPTN